MTNKKNGRKASSNAATSAAKKNQTSRRAAYKWNAGGIPDAATRKAIVATFAALRDATADHASEKESVVAYKRGLTANKTLDALIRASKLDAGAVTKASFPVIEAMLLGKDPATAYATTGEKIAAAVDRAAERAAHVYGDEDLAEMFAGATVEESDEPTQPGVFVMATAPKFTIAGMFATALAAEIFSAGDVITEAIPYGEMKADDGDGYCVSWYIENHRKA